MNPPQHSCQAKKTMMPAPGQRVRSTLYSSAISNIFAGSMKLHSLLETFVQSRNRGEDLNIIYKLQNL